VSPATSDPGEALLAEPAIEQGGGKGKCDGITLLWRKAFPAVVENMSD